MFVLTQAGVSGDGKIGVSCTLEGDLKLCNLSKSLDFFGERNADNKEDIGFDGEEGFCGLDFLRTLINTSFLGLSLKKSISFLHGLRNLDLKILNAFTFISNK